MTPGRVCAELDVRGGRIADQQLNGSVEWRDGANFHAERSMAPGAPFVSFSFHEGGTEWAGDPTP